MLRWSLTFFAFALVTAMLGFGGIATSSTETAKALFVLFLVGFVATLVLATTVARKIYP